MAKPVMSPELVTELLQQHGILTTASAVRWLGKVAVRWRLDGGRWQQPCRGVIVTRPGPLSSDEMLCAIVLGAGTDAVLGDLTATRLDGLTGFDAFARSCRRIRICPRSLLRTAGC